MKLQKKAVVASILLVGCVFIHLYSRNKLLVETGYSIQFFPEFSRSLRAIFGKIPFSFGDILYGILVIWIVWNFIRFAKLIINKQPWAFKKPLFKNAFISFFIFCASMYIVFNVFWGINYNRKGIAWQIGLKMENYSVEDLKQINAVLIEKINASKKMLMDNHSKYPANKELFEMVNVAYDEAAVKYPFLKYHPSSIKQSMWGWLGNYTGFTGYYNPFTAEAQLNTSVPKFLHPFISCHEVAHQLGYAKEMEANFVGYLAASNSGYTLFQYSVYLDLFVYAYHNLYFTDSAAAKTFRKQLSAGVIDDLKEWTAFNKKHSSFIEPVVSMLYGFYLRGNEQPAGVLSYDKVTGFIIAYYKKFGKI